MTMTTTGTTTTGTTGTTTDPTPGPVPGDSPSGRRRWRERLSHVSVRTRITTSVAVLAAWALAASGLLVWTLESRRVQTIVTDTVAQEIAELARLQDQGIDPETGRPFTTTQRLLETFLVRNVPDDDELFVSWWGDRPRSRSNHVLGEETVSDPGFRVAVRSLLPDGGNRMRDVEGVGEHLITVQPVQTRSGSEPGALVMVSYLDAERDELTRTMTTYAAVSLVLLLLIVGAAWLQAGRLLRPLRALHDSAEEINATDLSRRLPVEGNDDIGRLTRTYNAMLDRLQQGFASQRQFLDDAGHELRTPLTVLRGHLELVDPQDPHDVQETSDLLLDEIDRMSRLVDELILLAKSDRPDFVRPGPTGVAGLLEQVHRKAGALASERDWRLGELPPEHVTCQLDEQRITQALLQLCDNAVKHTGPGDRITLAASMHPGAQGGTTAGRLRLSVTDTGHGVAPEARERIFERFGRAEVPEGDEGFGLGLSIVRAIADAHEGTVRVEEGPEGGARFVIEIPDQEGTP